MRLKVTAICLVASIYGVFAQPVDTLRLSIEEVVEMLKVENLHIKASEYQLYKAESERKAQKGLYMPRIDISAAYTIMSEPLQLDLTPVRDAILPAYDLIGGQTDLLSNLTDYMAATGTIDAATYQSFVNGLGQLENGQQYAMDAINNGEWIKTIQEDQFAMVDASITWPIYTGGKIRAANKAAEAKLMEAKVESENVIASEITNVLQRYFGLKLAINVVEVRRKVVDGMQMHVHDAKKLEENGMLSHAECLHAEVSFVEANRELKKAQNTVELMQTALQNSLTLSQPVYPTTELFITNAADDLKMFVQSAQSQNPAVRKLEAKEILAEQALRNEQAGWYPSVFAFGRTDIVNYQLSDYMPDWMVGVGMQFNLFDGLQKVRKTQAARMQQLEVEMWQEKAKLDLATGVTSVFQQLQQAADNYESAQTTLEFADEYLRIRQKAFSEGFATSTNVVDAQLHMAKVQTEALKAKFDYDVALARLLELSAKSAEIVDYAK